MRQRESDEVNYCNTVSLSETKRRHSPNEDWESGENNRQPLWNFSLSLWLNLSVWLSLPPLFFFLHTHTHACTDTITGTPVVSHILCLPGVKREMAVSNWWESTLSLCWMEDRLDPICFSCWGRWRIEIASILGAQTQSQNPGIKNKGAASPASLSFVINRIFHKIVHLGMSA